ncbi:hypothetical protein U1Q18_016598 [Sarracenia purpurea var. burkii]
MGTNRGCMTVLEGLHSALLVAPGASTGGCAPKMVTSCLDSNLATRSAKMITGCVDSDVASKSKHIVTENLIKMVIL